MARKETEEERQANAENTQASAEGMAAGDELRGSEATREGAPKGTRFGLRESARVASTEYSGPAIGFVRDTVGGALDATGTVASSAVETVRDVLTGTLHAAEEVGTEALGAVGTLGTGIVTTARDILVTGVSGVKDVLGTAIPMRRQVGNGPEAERSVAERMSEHPTPERETLHARSTPNP